MMMYLLYILIFVVFIGLIIGRRWYNSPKQKGKQGELRVRNVLSDLPEEYHVLYDIVLKTEKGTTQIDHVVISKYGIFSIETKNYRGEIYGNDTQQKWTQLIVSEVTYAKKWWKTYTYVTKNHFYNPVKQSIGHAIRIKELLTTFPNIKVIPIVVFVGDAILSNIKSNHHVIYEDRLLEVIYTYKTCYLTDNDVQTILSILNKNNLREIVSERQHIENLRAAASEVNATINSGICPKCGGRLVERHGPYGTFFGCSNYPQCRFIVK